MKKKKTFIFMNISYKNKIFNEVSGINKGVRTKNTINHLYNYLSRCILNKNIIQ